MKKLFLLSMLVSVFLGCKKDKEEPIDTQIAISYGVEVSPNTVTNPASFVKMTYRTSSGELKTITNTGAQANKTFATEFFDSGLGKEAYIKMETNLTSPHSITTTIKRTPVISDKTTVIASQTGINTVELTAKID